MSVALNSFSAVLSATSFTFYLIGVIGYSLQREVIENVSWFTVDENGVNIYVGLRKTIFETNVGIQEIVYSRSSCNGDFCDACEREGDNAFALLVVATVFSFVAMALSITAAAAPSKEVSGANLACSFVALTFGVIGWSLFVQKCFYDEIDDATSQDFEYGPGSILPLIAFLVSALVVFLQIGSTVLSPSAAGVPAQPRAQAVATNEL